MIVSQSALDLAKKLVFDPNAIAADREYARALVSQHDPNWIAARTRQREAMGLGSGQPAVRLESSRDGSQRLVVSAAAAFAR